MKKLILALTILLTATFAQAADVVVEFSHQPDPDNATAKYTLYMDGITYCDFLVAAVVTNAESNLESQCAITMDEGTHGFKMSATYADGTVSPHSPTFYWKKPAAVDNAHPPIMIKIIINGQEYIVPPEQ